MTQKRISIWSGPRNVSTALMYAFRQRPDTIVVDEPLYGHYLANTSAHHPGDKDVLATMEKDADLLIEHLTLKEYERPVVFFKNMAHHLEQLDRSFLPQLDNVLLCRDPKEMLPSLAKNISPVLRDTGLKHQVELLDTLLARGQTPIVLDAKELLTNPHFVLNEACQQMGIPFYERMLEWPKGPKPEDGVWAKYWYKNVHASTGFAKYTPKTDPFPEELLPLLEICQPLYERLYGYAIKA